MPPATLRMCGKRSCSSATTRAELMPALQTTRTSASPGTPARPRAASASSVRRSSPLPGSRCQASNASASRTSSTITGRPSRSSRSKASALISCSAIRRSVPAGPPGPAAESRYDGAVFISFEGLDGCGKTTQARLLADALEAEGKRVVRVREPGGTPAGERIRELLLDPAARIGPRAEAMLYAAARAQLVEDVIRPALEGGAHVVADRFIDSSLAYQGVARGLGIDEVLALNAFGTGGLWPDRTCCCGSTPSWRPPAGGPGPDRIEAEHDDFHRAVADGFEQAARALPRADRAGRGGGTPEQVLAPRARGGGPVSVFEELGPQPRGACAAGGRAGRARPRLPAGRAAGSGKRRYAERFAAALLAPAAAAALGRPPDLFLVEPEGSGILMDQARALRRDLHMRPFEAQRRVYLVLDAHLLRDEQRQRPAQVAGGAARLRRLRARLRPRRADAADDPLAAGARALPPLLDRRADRRVGDPVAARARWATSSGPSGWRAIPTRPSAAAATSASPAPSLRDARVRPGRRGRRDARCAGAGGQGRDRRGGAAAGSALAQTVDDKREQKALEKRAAERAKRAGRRAELDELREALDTVAWWYRDVLAAAVGAEGVVVHSDLAGEAAEDAHHGAAQELARGLGVVAETRRSLDMNVQPALAIEALFHELRRASVQTM